VARVPHGGRDDADGSRKLDIVPKEDDETKIVERLSNATTLID
jgi:hypothetical protein